MDTPDDVIDLSTLYMKIYFVGMPFFMLYNYGAAVLRAVGDTKRPLFFLIISGVLNAGLNLFLVVVFPYGRGRCRYRHGDFPDGLLRAGADLSLPGGEQLSASSLED